MNLQESIEAMIKDTIRNCGNELIDSLDSRMYWAQESGDRSTRNALADVKESVQSAIEESVGVEP